MQSIRIILFTRSWKYLSFIFCFVLALTTLCSWQIAAAQSTTLLVDQGVSVTCNSVKTKSSGKKDTWNFDLTISMPAVDMYFTVSKTGDLLQDIHLNRFLKIQLVNHAGVFGSGEKFLTAEPAQLITTDGSVVYAVQAQTRHESFTMDVPAGKSPIVKASLLVELKSKTEISFLRATEEEIFSGTFPDGQMFLYYRDLDTLLTLRSRTLLFLDRQSRRAEATWGNGQFLINDSLVSLLTCQDWQRKPVGLRIVANTFELSRRRDFSDSERKEEIRIKDGDGNNRLVRLLQKSANVLTLNKTVQLSELPISDNGQYLLAFGADGSFQLRDRYSGQVMWSDMMVGNTYKLSTMRNNNHVTVRLLSNTVDANGMNVGGAFLAVRGERLVVFREDGLAVWQSRSAQ